MYLVYARAAKGERNTLKGQLRMRRSWQEKPGTPPLNEAWGPFWWEMTEKLDVWIWEPIQRCIKTSRSMSSLWCFSITFWASLK